MDLQCQGQNGSCNVGLGKVYFIHYSPTSPLMVSSNLWEQKRNRAKIFISEVQLHHLVADNSL